MRCDTCCYVAGCQLPRGYSPTGGPYASIIFLAGANQDTHGIEYAWDRVETWVAQSSEVQVPVRFESESQNDRGESSFNAHLKEKNIIESANTMVAEHEIGVKSITERESTAPIKVAKDLLAKQVYVLENDCSKP